MNNHVLSFIQINFILNFQFKLINSILCTNLPQFLNQSIGHGIDIASVDLYPRLIDFQHGYTIFKEQIIALNCNKNEFIKIQKQDYQLPDEVFRVYDYLSQDYTRHGIGFKDESDYRKNMASQFGFNLIDGVLRSSPSYRRMKRQEHPRIRDRVQYIQIQKNILLREQYSLKLSEKAENEFKKLPEDYNDNPRAFEDFIDRFGTHYFYKIYYGEAARIEFEKLTDKEKQEVTDYLQHNSFSSNNKVNLGKKFTISSNKNLNIDQSKEFIYNISNLVRFGMFAEEQSIFLENDRNWRLIRKDEMRRKILTIYGGEIDFNINDTYKYRRFNINNRRQLKLENPLQRDLMNTWINRALYLWPLHGKVSPLENLLPDGLRKESFKKAVKFHLEAAELEDGN